MQTRLPAILTIIAGAAILPPTSTPATAGIHELREANKQAIVRINVTGTTPSGEEISEAGSGFVFCSRNGLTYIATAAHVLLLDRKLHDRESGEPDREIAMYFLDDTDAINLYQGSLSIIDFRFDERSGKDWAIVAANRNWRSVLPPGRPNELRSGEEAVLLGYTGGSDVVQPTPLTLEAPDVKRGLTLGFGRAVPKGQSGGAVLDSQGRVVGIASANLRDESGSHRAVPVSALSGAMIEHGLSPACDEPTAGESGSETAGQPRTRVALFRYRGAVAGQQDLANVKFDLFRGIIEQKLANLKKQVSQTWDAVGGDREGTMYLSDVHVGYEDQDDFTRTSEVFSWMAKEADVLNVMRGSIVSDDNLSYQVFSRVYLSDVLPNRKSDEVLVDLPVNSSEFANTRDTHTLVILYALAMDAKRLGRPADQVALLLRAAEPVIADLERRLQILPADLARIKSVISDASGEILGSGHAVSGSP